MGSQRIFRHHNFCVPTLASWNIGCFVMFTLSRTNNRRQYYSSCSRCSSAIDSLKIHTLCAEGGCANIQYLEQSANFAQIDAVTSPLNLAKLPP